MKKQTWLLVSVALKTLCLTPIIVFAVLLIRNPIAFTSRVGSAIVILGLLTVLIYDVSPLFEKKSSSKTRGFIRNSLYIAIPIAWFIAAAILALNIDDSVYLRFFEEALIRGYGISILCLLLIIIVDIWKQKRPITVSIYLSRFIYVVVPVIWFIVLLFVSLSNMRPLLM